MLKTEGKKKIDKYENFLLKIYQISLFIPISCYELSQKKYSILAGASFWNPL